MIKFLKGFFYALSCMLAGTAISAIMFFMARYPLYELIGAFIIIPIVTGIVWMR